MNEVLNAQKITKFYMQGSEKLEVITGLDLQMQEGEVIALIGPSGSGKSTLLHLLGLLDKMNDGTLFLDGVDCSKIDDARRTGLRLEKLGFIYQFHNLLPDFTALENVAMPLIIAGQAQKLAHAKALEALELMGLTDRVKHYPSELSGGQQQRVAIARAMVHKPRLILADEPTGNLDHVTGEAVFNEMLKLIKSNKSSLLVVTHNLELAKKCDKIYHLLDGKVTKV